MNRLLSGSEAFGTEVIKTDEYVLLAEVITDNGQSTQKAMAKITAIDDLLQIQRMRLIIAGQRTTKTGRVRKDSSMTDFVSKRLDALMQELQEL